MIERVPRGCLGTTAKPLVWVSSLAVVPYGVTAPALGLLALGLGLMNSDGLMVVIGYSLAVVTLCFLVITV